MSEPNSQLSTTDDLQVIPHSALESIERAQIDVQITTAKRYPRTLSVVKKAMLEFATLDEETAASCFYTLTRKGRDGEKAIQGPGIRLAEIALSCFQNIRAGARIIENDGKTITAQGVCHDLQNNVSVSVDVKRRITDKNGRIYSEDMQVVTGNAACAIALRNAVFKVIPGALVQPVYEAAKKVAIGDATTLSTRRQKCVEFFGKLGVSRERLLAKLEKKSVEDITLDDLSTLIGLQTGLKEGDTTIDESFPLPATKPTVKVSEPAKPVQEPPKEEKPEETPAPAADEPVDEKPADSGPSPRERLRILVEEGNWSEAQCLKALRTLRQISASVADYAGIPDSVVDACLSDPGTLFATLEKIFAK